MGFSKWHLDKKTKQYHELGSSSALSRSATSHHISSASFSIFPLAVVPRFRPYVQVMICRWYWETDTFLSWSDAHLPNG
ncbi:hypothetical protein D1007_34389 [Hordeum vulgare]|nr:hypothetical protein D1007_34389 [Hordeum vulgare]